jgi:DNA-binding CsgD family transcriptional regulator
MLVDAYALTPRQREVLRLLLRGGSRTQIAQQLRISEHTANDHPKAIYARMDVASRSELAARLQTDQYNPRSQASHAPSPYGGYLAN